MGLGGVFELEPARRWFLFLHMGLVLVGVDDETVCGGCGVLRQGILLFKGEVFVGLFETDIGLVVGQWGKARTPNTARVVVGRGN